MKHLIKFVFWAFEILGALVAYGYSLLYIKDYIGAFFYAFISFDIAVMLVFVTMSYTKKFHKKMFATIVGKFFFGVVISALVNALIATMWIDVGIFVFILIATIAIEMYKDYKKKKNK